MDNIEKFIRKLTPKMRMRVFNAYHSIAENRLNKINYKPLRGKKKWFSCRIGNVRIVFIRLEHGGNVIIEVQFRGKAYRKI